MEMNDVNIKKLVQSQQVKHLDTIDILLPVFSIRINIFNRRVFEIKTFNKAPVTLCFNKLKSNLLKVRKM